MAGFVKRRVAAPTGFFGVEAAGLRWLAEAGGARVAAVLDVGTEALTIERIPPATPTQAAAAAFGAALARTHDASAAAFGSGPDGWQGDGYIGDAPLPLRPTERWGGFYADQRVLPYAWAAHRTGALSDAELTTVQQLCERLRAGDFDDDAPPARLHGDLWSGNVLWSPGGVVLIDPAAHGGHRITDLAMLTLFGSPFLATILQAYESASGHLPGHWRELVALHQVHPLLVHAQLFGGGYGSQAAAAAQRYLA
ncbi:MAG: fructosamine kinase family protein [Propionibacteriaceae bacterium]|nr:fructosamine kinase family protein [Propionibacteriaceae bacterium]